MTFDLDDLDLSKNEPLKLISGAALHLPSKFGEDRSKDLGGVGEQTNKQTDKRCSNYSTMCIQYKYVLLTGDFNARTWTKDDFTTADDFLADHFDFDDTIRTFFNASSVLLDNNMNLRRISHDTVCNNEGNALLEICKSNNLCILNGRCGKDKNLGSFTFKPRNIFKKDNCRRLISVLQ